MRTPNGIDPKLLRIYLRDHLAVATVSVELAARTLEENRDTPLEPLLQRVVVELEEDRAALRNVSRTVGYPPPRRTEAAAWLGEKLGRLKRNGRWVRYSPLSRVNELEALAVLAEQRKLMWRALALCADHDDRLIGSQLSHQAEVAERQQEALEARLLDAVDLALRRGSEEAPPRAESGASR